MKIAALITARIGSKRLPRKNIKLLGGRPLLFWSIDAALRAGVFSEVCVSTESLEVSELIRGSYSENEVKVVARPPELATDSASLNDVCKHLLEIRPEIDFLSLMMPTYPFRQAERIVEEIIPSLYSRQIDRVVSVRYGNYSSFDYWIPSGDFYVRMYRHVPLWCGAGNAAYLTQKRDYYFLPPHKWPYRIGERTLRIQTNYKESIDIDTIEDFEKAERICAGRKRSPKRLIQHEALPVEVVAPEGADAAALLAFLVGKGIRLDLPVLILRKADPLFTFLRLYECNSSRSYTTEETNKIISNLPSSGHSQDFPTHFIHSPYYRVLRKNHDKDGIHEDSILASQVTFEQELKRDWQDYVDPVAWI